MKTYKEFLEEKIKWESIGNWKVSKNTGSFELKYKNVGSKYELWIDLIGKKENPLFNDFEKMSRKYNSNIKSNGNRHIFKIINLSKNELIKILSEIE